MTSTKCRINTVVSPDDGHTVARNMYRLIHIRRINLRTKLVLFARIYRDAGQQNIKLFLFFTLVPVREKLFTDIIRVCIRYEKFGYWYLFPAANFSFHVTKN